MGDKNCDGYLDFDEIKAVLDTVGEKFEEWEIKTFIAEGDKNDDGKMDYEEWIDIMKHTPQM